MHPKASVASRPASYVAALTLSLTVEDGFFGDWRVSQSLRLGVFETRSRHWWCSSLMDVRRRIVSCIRRQGDVIERSAASGRSTSINARGTATTALAFAGLGKSIGAALGRSRIRCAEDRERILLEVGVYPVKTHATGQLSFELSTPDLSPGGGVNVLRFPSRQERLALDTPLGVAFADDVRLFQLASELVERGVHTVGDLRMTPKAALRTLAANDMVYLRLELRLFEFGLAS